MATKNPSFIPGIILHLGKLSHSGSVLAYIALIEQTLVDLIETAMPGLNSDLRDRLFRGYGPLATLKARIDTARALGLISSSQRKLLHKMRDVRNAFAHPKHPSIDFDHESIMKLMALLPAPRSQIPTNGLHHFVALAQEALDDLTLCLRARNAQTLQPSLGK